MENFLISIDGASVSVNDGKKKLLSDIKWRLMPGQNWVFLGANGSGKSTLLKLIRGDIWPDNGGKRVYNNLNGEISGSPVGIRESIAFISAERQQAYVRNGWDLAGEEVIYTGFSDSVWMYGEASLPQKEKVSRLALSLGLGPLLKKSILEMSDGEARKILIARALVSGPRILILDEFAGGLDLRSRRKLLQFVEKAALSGTQILYATHRMEEMVPSITNALLLKDGRIIAQGRAADVLRPKVLNRALPKSGGACTKLKKKTAPRPVEGKGGFLIKIEKADVYIGNRKILRDINWRLKRGESWGIMGRNGAGKSTFAKLAAGELTPAFGGKVVRHGITGNASIAEIRKRVGYISSELLAGYDWNLTGEEVVQSGFFSSIGLFSKVSREQKRTALDWFDFFGLGHIRKKRIHEMSYGESRKLLMARAMVNSPEILVLDEPLKGLDIPSRSEILQQMEIIAREGATLLMITHYPDELIPSIANVLLIENGRIKTACKKEDLYVHWD